MRLATPGHGGSRLRVRSHYVKTTGYHHGVVQRRVGPLWLTIGIACGRTPNEALRDGMENARKWETRTKKSVTYL
jgi:hypothetical protein